MSYKQQNFGEGERWQKRKSAILGFLQWLRFITSQTHWVSLSFLSGQKVQLCLHFPLNGQKQWVLSWIISWFWETTPSFKLPWARTRPPRFWPRKATSPLFSSVWRWRPWASPLRWSPSRWCTAWPSLPRVGTGSGPTRLHLLKKT